MECRVHDEATLSQTKLERLKTGLVPFYQPIVEVSTGAITAFEVLARYRDEDGRVSSAAHLFGNAELSIPDRRALDQHVRRQAIEQLAYLPEDTRLTLNISPELIEYVQGVPQILTVDMLRTADVSAQKVVIELIETDGQIADLKKLVMAYRSAGLRLAVDDFGAGFSHFDRVIELMPDVIKLDMRLLKKGSNGSRIADSAVHSIVDFCAKSGAVIVVEGVETEEEFFFALGCGAHYMQGFLFSKAVDHFLPKDTFSKQIAALRKAFFNRKKLAMQGEIESNTLLLGTMNQIVQDSNDKSFTTAGVGDALIGIKDLLRYFLTDYEGQQVSPNYLLRSDGQFVDENTKWQGVNWSWRPYFCEACCSDTAIVSGTYLDIHSGKKCKTVVVRLGNGNILLVDVSVEQ